jgi:acyl-CoA dehydrogenase
MAGPSEISSRTGHAFYFLILGGSFGPPGKEKFMPFYRAPLDDMVFLLNDVFHVERFANLPGFRDASPDVVTAILTLAAKFAEDVLTPLNRSGDEEGCRRNEHGGVTTPTGFKEAYRRFVESGFIGISVPTEYGGLGLPAALTQAVNEFFVSANISFAMYPSLSQGAIAALLTHGSAEQKALYVPKLVAGEWSGTMNLTEPQCGTDVGLTRTKAVRQDDGSYRISGTKIFISSGEHDLAANIVHLVLARIEGAPAGTRGLSLFIVPKFIPGADGMPGIANAVSCGAIERKMGIHGNATCVMNYDGATGWLVGEEKHGLPAMFVMMNKARLGVGLQGLALSEVAYQNAAQYAKDRLQGRALSGPAQPDKPADPIIVHPDVRRMLMTIRAFNEAARALIMWLSIDSDVARYSDDDGARHAAEDRLGLLTPVVKGVLTDLGFENAVLAQQIFGGHGYIRESGMEQFVRDARIPMIYEGTNGIQALDLVGRKLAKDGGRAITAFFNEVSAYVKERAADPSMRPFVAPVGTALGDLQQATLWFMQNAIGKPDNAGAGATDYMHLLGLVVLGYMWCRIAEAAAARRAGDTTGRMQAKLVTARFFVDRMLPETASHLARIRAGAASVMDMPAELF